MPRTLSLVRLAVSASQVGLEGVTINGMAFTRYGGHAWWDRAGVRHNSWRATKYYRFNGQVVAMRKNGVLSYLHGDHLGSTVLTSNSSGAFTGQDLRHAYGRYRAGTENRFTGQKSDGAGLMYFNARYYDPRVPVGRGQFLSPDTLVPDPSNLFDYNRYMYARGNLMKYTDPTGHYSSGELMQHFGCEDWQCVEWQFDSQNYGSAYRSNGGWLQVLLDAVDGDKITAWNPDQNQTMSGQFLRNADTGQIGIQMVLSNGQLAGAIPESAFAAYGAVNPYAGGQRYALQSAKYSKRVGQTYHLSGGYNLWDCTAICLGLS